MKKLGFLVAIGFGALAAGCGGGSSTPPPAPTATPTATPPTPTPSPMPTPGPVMLSVASSFGATTSPAATANVNFPAPSLSATLTATSANYTGPFTASVAAGCTQLTVTPAMAANGVFTVTGSKPETSGCSVTVTGATGFPAGTLATTVATPGGIALRWYAPQYLTQSPPVAISQSPINLVGLGPTFAAVLAISEQNFAGSFSTPTLSAPCNGVVSIAPAPAPTGLPTAPPISTGVAAVSTYYTVMAAQVPNPPLPLTGTCTITTMDSFAPTVPASINVQVTSTSGVFQ